MEEPVSESKSSPDIQRVVIIGCSLLTLILLLTCAITFAAIFREQIPLVKNYFPSATPTQTLTPTPTTIPHILVHMPSANTVILKDDFTTNTNDWSTYYSDAKVEVKNGKLALESFDSGSIGIAYCFCKSPAGLPVNELYYADNYYLQADLSTENATADNYGLIFGLAKGVGFYEFSINSTRKKYYLQKNEKSGWVNLDSGSSQIINDYPEANTLSVYFDHGSIELFINGVKVTTHVDKTPINKGKIGFIADDANFKLLIDNLFVYNEK